MTGMDRIRHEIHLAESYTGPDAAGALMGSMDWRMEKRLLEQELKQDEQYQQFLQRKEHRWEPCGFTAGDISTVLFPFQVDIVRWALRRGRCAIFADCGMGKGLMALEWARHVRDYTGKPALIFAPLAVAQQFKRESEKLGYSHLVKVCESDADVHDGINVTNYEKMHHFTPDQFGGVVCDESSIIKSQDGKTRKLLMEFCAGINFRLACTATPSPNDYMELGSHAEFLGVMRHVEMLSLFFVHDGGETAKWRLKGHAETAFWKWVCSWAVAIRKPSDLGYDDGGFVLPPLRMHQITVPADRSCDGFLFPMEAQTLDERRSARRNSIDARVEACAELAIKSPDQWLIWCNLNAESESVSDAIADAVEVTGSDTSETKESRLLGFIAGNHRVLATKPLIAGFGLNLQNCHKVAFLGLSDSYEQLYQAIRRCWRFGQDKPVDVYVITAETEGAVVRNIERKEKQAMEMMEEMVKHMKTEMQKEVRGLVRETSAYEKATATSEDGKRWIYHMGDCVELFTAMPTGSVDFSVFSPPFSSLYTYSNSDRDMGNSTDAQFWEHFQFLIPQLYRVLKPGRLISFHCMNLPSTKERDGYIGIKDFRGDLIRAFQKAGFIYHSEVCIWKDPVTAMQRTKAIGLLYKQLRKDSALSRQGIPDYLVTMRKPEQNPVPITKVAPPAGSTYKHARNVPANEFPVERWQQYASPVWEFGDKKVSVFDFVDPRVYQSLSEEAKVEIMRTVLHHAEKVMLSPVPDPVWMDINPSDTLQRLSAREEDDERHICPLQLQVIERAIELWTNPGEVVASPFGGIASEGYVALKMGRRFIGTELKRSYWEQGVRNLKEAEKGAQSGLFSMMEEEPA